MLFAQSLEQLRAAGEATRLRTLALLRRGDLTVTELTRCLDQSQPRVSRHLRILVDVGLIQPYQEGSWRFYRLGDVPAWLALLIDGLSGPEIERDRVAFDEVRHARAERAARFFSANAPKWDALRRLHIDDAVIERTILNLAPDHVDTLVDFGTGTGRMLIVFRDHYDHAVGYDLSPEMLEIARVRLEEEQLVSAQVRRRDILAEDEVAPASADLICLHHVLHFLGEPEAAIRVAAQALRPGGSVLIADFAPHEHEVLRDQFAHRRLGFATEEIERMAQDTDLVLAAQESLKPQHDDGLTSVIWRLDKPNHVAPQSTHREKFFFIDYR